MKKQLFFILLLTVAINSFSQSYPKKNPESKEYFLQKSKQQKTAAWILLSGGTVLFVGGYTLFVYEGLQGDGVQSAKAKLDIALFFVGGAAMISSVPLFIAAARNKGIATSITAGVKMEKNIANLHPSFIKSSFPALSLKINLR